MDTPQRHYSLLIWTRALSDSLFVLHILRDALEFQNRADALTDLAVRTHQRRSFARGFVPPMPVPESRAARAQSSTSSRCSHRGSSMSSRCSHRRQLQELTLLTLRQLDELTLLT